MNYVDPKIGKHLPPGAARCPAITTQEIIAGDAVPAPDWVRSESYTFLGDEDISADRYTKAAYAEAEMQRMWPRTWQFACREEHIPEAGDYYVYDVGPYSLIVTRVGEGDSLATTHSFKDGEGNCQTETEWHRITCFIGVGKCVAAHVTKGAMVMVTGRVHYSRWTDSEGQTRYGCEIIAEQVDFLAKAKEATSEEPKKRRSK